MIKFDDGSDENHGDNLADLERMWSLFRTLCAPFETWAEECGSGGTWQDSNAHQQLEIAVESIAERMRDGEDFALFEIEKASDGD